MLDFPNTTVSTSYNETAKDQSKAKSATIRTDQVVPASNSPPERVRPLEQGLIDEIFADAT